MSNFFNFAGTFMHSREEREIFPCGKICQNEKNWRKNRASKEQFIIFFVLLDLEMNDTANSSVTRQIMVQ